MSVSKTKNKDLKYGKEEVLSVSGELGIVNQIEHLGRSYAGVSVHNYGVVELNQIVYTKSPLKVNPYGIIKLNKSKAGIVSTLYAVYTVNEKTDGQFIEYYFSLDANLNRYLRPLVKKGAKNDMKISNEYVLNDPVFAPKLQEQQKIASFLSKVDEKLQQLTKKKDLLEEYKKGVMQKIFSQELRFKDEFGNNYPNWEEKKLGEVCDVTVGGTPSTTKKEYWNGDIGWISSGAMNNGNVTQPSKLITKLGLDSSSAKMMPENTVMLAMTGATFGKIGYLKFNSSANQSVAGFLPNETYNSKYLFYTLKQGINQVFKYSGGAAQQGINKQSILNLKYKFPSLEEQQKIANFLTSLDSKIDLVSTQIENTKAFKKGLLQQMFV